MGLDIALIEPFFGESHAKWMRILMERSRHQFRSYTLEGRNWRWRMRGGAIELAARFNDANERPDLILATDMLDLSTFLALSRERTNGVPTVVYFHENQLMYPWKGQEQGTIGKEQAHYGLINYTTALSADRLFFNSEFHQQGFFEALRSFLQRFPDHQTLEELDGLPGKSAVLPLAMELRALDRNAQGPSGKGEGAPLILWNHRWEFDKAPERFFRVLYRLAEEGYPFRLAILGESPDKKEPEAFREARERLGDHIVAYGYRDAFEDYVQWLHAADILPVTADQDFFGGSVVEAIYCGTWPILPDRLAYPEHIPASERKDHLYRDEGELVDRLRDLLSDPEKLATKNIRHWVEQYDAKVLVPRYDEALEEAARFSRPDSRTPP